jgi:hypothetical protein
LTFAFVCIVKWENFPRKGLQLSAKIAHLAALQQKQCNQTAIYAHPVTFSQIMAAPHAPGAWKEHTIICMGLQQAQIAYNALQARLIRTLLSLHALFAVLAPTTIKTAPPRVIVVPMEVTAWILGLLRRRHVSHAKKEHLAPSKETRCATCVQKALMAQHTE